MKSAAAHRILSADHCLGGVVITFDDGKTALFPTSLLYDSLSQIAGVIDGPGPEELEEEQPLLISPIPDLHRIWTHAATGALSEFPSVM
jgi:hypothetical protein